MKKYIITDIGRDMDRGVEERIGLGIKTIDTDVKLNVYCQDEQEYIDGDKARKNGDIIEGELYIQRAYFVKKTDFKLQHKWTRLEISRVSPYIEVVVKVTRIVNEYTICGITDFTEEEIPIRFSYVEKNSNANKKLFKEGDIILLSGAILCFDPWGYTETFRRNCGL